jgi:hypothetical protein
MGSDDPPQIGPALDDQGQKRRADLARNPVIAPHLAPHVRHDNARYELTRVLDLDMQRGIPVGTRKNGAVLPFDFRTPPHAATRHAHEHGVIVELPPQRRHVALVPRGGEADGKLPGDLCIVHGDMLGDPLPGASRDFLRWLPVGKECVGLADFTKSLGCVAHQARPIRRT